MALAAIKEVGRKARPKSCEPGSIAGPKRAVGFAPAARHSGGQEADPIMGTPAADKLLSDCILFLAESATEAELRSALYLEDLSSGWWLQSTNRLSSLGQEKFTVPGAVQFIKHYLRSLKSPLIPPLLARDLLPHVQPDNGTDPVERALVLHMYNHRYSTPERERILFALINMFGACAARTRGKQSSEQAASTTSTTESNSPRTASAALARDFAPLLFGITNSAAAAPPAGPMFGVSLTDLTAKQPNPNNVPWIVQACCEALRPHLLTTEGLFRVAPDESAVMTTKNALQGSCLMIWSGSQLDPHLVATLIQRFLAELPEPLLTYELYDQLLTAVLVATDAAPLVAVLQKLPLLNRSVLFTLMCTLRTIAMSEATTKMNAANLGVVLGPLLLRGNAAKLDKRALRLQCKVVSTLLGLTVDELRNALVPEGVSALSHAAAVLECFIAHDSQLEFVSSNVELDPKGLPVRISKELAQVVICSDLPVLSWIQSLLVEFREYLFNKEELKTLLHRRLATGRRRGSILEPLMRSLSYEAPENPPEPLITVSSPRGSILVSHYQNETIEVLASSIFKADALLFRRISHTELLKGRFKKAESHFSAFASHYNQLAQWIATEVIVQDKDIARRTQAVRAALMLADLLRSQFDFSAAYAVVGGLSHAAVTRLTKTWASLHPSDLLLWQELQAFFATDGDWKHIRTAMAAVPSGAALIPYLGMFTRRITAMEEANPTVLCGQVNVSKLMMMLNVINEFRKIQDRCSKIAIDPATVKLTLPVLSEDTLFERSLQLEERALSRASSGDVTLRV